MLNKKVLAAAVVGVLFTGNAAAAVVLGTDPALKFASELTASVNLATATTVDDISVALGYNLSVGEVRYGRLECTNNIQMGGTVSVTASDATATGVTVGSINGISTNALFFSLTKGATAGATSALTLAVTSDNTLTNSGDVNCAWSLYDQPSQAQAGGDVGRIYTTGFKPFITRASGFSFTGTAGQATADVGATPAYTRFTGNTLTGVFGALSFQPVTGVLKANGTQIALTDIFANTTKVIVEGDFSAADDVAWNATTLASPVSTTSATFTGNTAVNGNLAYIANGTGEIQVENNYVAKLDPVFNTGYAAAGATASQAVGKINRNGTELQAPLVQVPGGWLARVALSNTGTEARTYSVKVLTEAGKTFVIAPAKLTGSIPANGTRVIELNDEDLDLAGGSGRRGTVIVTVDAPNGQIQGLYQVVNPTNGLITNHVMVRPGTN